MNNVLETYVLTRLIPLSIWSKTLHLQKEVNNLVATIVKGIIPDHDSSSANYNTSTPKKFSTTEFFFVSTNIAKKYPDLPEGIK